MEDRTVYIALTQFYKFFETINYLHLFGQKPNSMKRLNARLIKRKLTARGR